MGSFGDFRFWRKRGTFFCLGTWGSGSGFISSLYWVWLWGEREWLWRIRHDVPLWSFSEPPAHPTMERGRTMSRISVPKGAANFRGRKSNSLMNLCGKIKNCLQLYRWGLFRVCATCCGPEYYFHWWFAFSFCRFYSEWFKSSCLLLLPLRLVAVN